MKHNAILTAWQYAEEVERRLKLTPTERQAEDAERLTDAAVRVQYAHILLSSIDAAAYDKAQQGSRRPIHARMLRDAKNLETRLYRAARFCRSVDGGGWWI